MKKALLSALLIAVVLFGAVATSTSVNAASAEEVKQKLVGLWKLSTTGGMYQQFNMVPPGYLQLKADGNWSFWLTIKGKGKFATKGNKFELKVPAETGGDATIYLIQTHMFLGGRWKAAPGKAGGPVEFINDKKAKISFLNLKKYAVPEAGNDYISLTWVKIR